MPTPYLHSEEDILKFPKLPDGQQYYAVQLTPNKYELLVVSLTDSSIYTKVQGKSCPSSHMYTQMVLNNVSLLFMVGSHTPKLQHITLIDFVDEKTFDLMMSTMIANANKTLKLFDN